MVLRRILQRRATSLPSRRGHVSFDLCYSDGRWKTSCSQERSGPGVDGPSEVESSSESRVPFRPLFSSHPLFELEAERWLFFPLFLFRLVPALENSPIKQQPSLLLDPPPLPFDSPPLSKSSTSQISPSPVKVSPNDTFSEEETPSDRAGRTLSLRGSLGGWITSRPGRVWENCWSFRNRSRLQFRRGIGRERWCGESTLQGGYRSIPCESSSQFSLEKELGLTQTRRFFCSQALALRVDRRRTNGRYDAQRSHLCSASSFET